MKKILILLITIYSFSFSAGVDLTAIEFNTALSGKKCNITTYNNGSGGSTSRITYSYNNGYYYMTSVTQGEYDSTAGTYLGGSNFTFRYSSCGVSETPTNLDCPKGKYFIDSSILYECSAGSVILPYIPIDDNATYTPNDDGSNLEKTCNDTFTDLNGVCTPTPDNGYFDEGGNLLCNSPYVSNGTTCELPEGTNPDNSCSSGYYKDLLTNTCKPTSVINNPDGTTTTEDSNGTTTSYPNETTVNIDPTTGVITTNYPDGTTITEYPDGTTTTGGSVSGGTGDSNNNSSLGNGNTSSFMCDDGAPSLVTETGFQTCDRTCESVGYIGTGIGTDRVCSSAASCPDGQTKTGNDLLGNPICYEMSNNADIDLNKIESLLGNIKDNTSLDKNSNKQLGTINNNIVRTNGKLEAVKGGLSIINKNVVTTNGKLEAVKGGLSIVDTSVNKVNTSLEASNGYLDGIATILSDMVSPIDTDKQNEYETQISSHLTNTLNDSFSKYSNVLGFGSSYGTTPSNITVTLFNTEFTLIDFTILDNFVSIIRSLFHTLAYLYGFMFFLRGSK